MSLSCRFQRPVLAALRGADGVSLFVSISTCGRPTGGFARCRRCDVSLFVSISTCGRPTGGSARCRWRETSLFVGLAAALRSAELVESSRVLITSHISRLVDQTVAIWSHISQLVGQTVAIYLIPTGFNCLWLPPTAADWSARLTPTVLDWLPTATNYARLFSTDRRNGVQLNSIGSAEINWIQPGSTDPDWLQLLEWSWVESEVVGWSGGILRSTEIAVMTFLGELSSPNLWTTSVNNDCGFVHHLSAADNQYFL